LALARKYRPKSFDDLVGQEAVSLTLSHALANGRLSHAYLFSGLRGSGKTSTARIFAKSLLCEEGPTPNPCQKCPQCQMANENRHIDIIEMDGASNRGIDDIKELIEHTKYKPSVGRFKIFIIDEVHMLTIQAFNALLKTLEEPPEFVKFILATTDPLKLPATILSRVQHFRFRKISQKRIQSHLEHILNIEGVAYDKDAISIIARVGSGSLRDALTLLDQAIVSAKSRVDTTTVTKMLGVIEPSVLDELLDKILARDEKAILEFISNSLEFEAEMIIDELILHTKELLLKRDSRFSPLILDRFFRALASAKELLHIGSDGEFVLTLTLFKMVEALSISKIDDMIEEIKSQLKDDRFISPQPKPKPLKSLQKPKKSPQNFDSNEIWREKFAILLKKIYDRDPALGDIFAKNIEFVSYTDKKLTWQSKASGEDKNRLKLNWIIIRTLVQDIFGIETKIENIQAPLQTPPAQSTKTENTPAPLETPQPNEIKNQSKKSNDILEQPMIKKAIKLFNAKKVIVKTKQKPKDES